MKNDKKLTISYENIWHFLQWKYQNAGPDKRIFSVDEGIFIYIVCPFINESFSRFSDRPDCNAVDFHLVVNLNQQIRTSVDDACFH